MALPRNRPLLIVAALLLGAAVVLGATRLVHGSGGRRKLPQRPTREIPTALALTARQGPSPVRFVDCTAASGVDFEEVNGYGDGGWFYVETLGSGVVCFDADGDGDLDLYFCNGAHLVGTTQDPPPRDQLFRNDGHGHFVDATAESGLGDTHYSMAACAADYDNDGDLDLYVTSFDEPNVLYRNDGAGHFTDVTAASGTAGNAAGTEGACAFADVDGDGWLDLFVGGCVEHSRTKNKPCRDAILDTKTLTRRYCNPIDYQPIPDTLLRNRGDGTFEDVSVAAGVADHSGRALGVAFCDFDDDGDQDLYVANDRSPSELLINDGHGHFTDEGMAAGVAVDPDGRAQASMGIAVGDYDGDGRMDFAVTYFEKEWNGLYHNEGDHLFTDQAGPSGTAGPSFSKLGWGTEFFDADLDGKLDWLVLNGHVHPNIEQLRPPDSHDGYAQQPLFFLNRGNGQFENLREEAGPALAARHTARGLAVGDFDGDGDLDVAINSNHSRATIWRNESPRADRHWLMVKTVGAARADLSTGKSGSNRDGIGARVIVHAGGQTQIREVHTGQSYFSQGDLRVHFGLGAATKADLVEVRWPSGRVSQLRDVPADQIVVIPEPT